MTVDPNAEAPSIEDDVRAVAQTHGLGPREIAALTIFVERIRAGDEGSRVMQKWRDHAVLRLAESLDALELEPVRRAKDAADVGSGAGFPGLALAAALPATRLTLIEQNGRRCRFLEECAEAMALTNVTVVQTSVQVWADRGPRFDLVTSRGVMHPPVMIRLAAPLLTAGGALVLWAHDSKHDDVVGEVRTAALRSSLSPAAIMGEDGLCLHVFTKRESPSAAATASRQPPRRLDRSRSVQRFNRSRSGEQGKARETLKDRGKATRKRAECEARIAKVSARIAELTEKRAHATEPQFANIDSQIKQLEEHRVALAEQLEFQKSLLSAQPRERDPVRLLALYEHEDRVGSNDEARRLFGKNPSALDELQSELVARLKADGVAEVEFVRLFSADLWKKVVADAAAFRRDAERAHARECDASAKIAAKERVQRRYQKGIELPSDDPGMQIALSPRLLDVVNAYLEMWTKLTHYNQVYRAPLPESAEVWERWHRDSQDKCLVKVSVHLSDADFSPFQYVAGSTGEGPYTGLWPWTPGARRYPPAEEFAKSVPDSAIRTLSARTGTIILSNTSGFHREGFATERPQILWNYRYSSPASLPFSERKFRVVVPDACGLTEEAQFAVS